MSKPGAVANFGVFAKSKATKDKNKITADKKAAKRAAIKVSYDHYGQILKYNASAAEGSQLFTSLSPKDDMRRFLLGSVTAGAIMLYGGRNAKAGPDLCGKVGGVYTCQGDQSAGVNYNNTNVLTTLNVNSLDRDAGGISVTENGDITVNVNTDAYAIITNNQGIGVTSSTGKITIDSTGNITSNFNSGISANNLGAGEIDIKHNGKIQSRSAGIFADANTGKVTVDNTGDITSDNSNGILARNFGATEVYVKNDGNIKSQSYGIHAYSSTGKVTVDSRGDINSNISRGIIAFNLGAGEISIKNDGNIKSLSSGFYAFSSTGKVIIDSKGDITSQGFRGIEIINSGAAESYAKNDGKIQSLLDGIFTFSSTGKVTVDSKGDINSDSSRGISAISSGAGVINVKNNGKIQSELQGIWAESTGGGITVDSTGDITSTNQHGIYARDNGSGSVYVKSRGNFQGKYEGIVGRSLGGGGVKIDSIGNIVATDDQGIFAQDLAAGAIDLKTEGKIDSLQDAIYARSSGGGVTVDSSGDLTSSTGIGISARDLSNGDVEVVNDGKIESDDEGISAVSDGGRVTVDSKGDITSDIGRGIVAANSGPGEINVKNDGIIQSNDEGVYVVSFAKITVDSRGDITSDNERGLTAAGLGASETYLKNDGAIQSSSSGIFAYSYGGGVTVDSTGDITSDTSDGVDVRSNGGNLDVTITSGIINGADDGIDFINGSTNTLTNYGTLLGGDKAIEADSGDETIHNHGTVIGNVDLGTGTNAFNNKTTGFFRSGATVDLGGGLLTNEGELTPGGVNTVQNTALTGNLVQTADGNFVVDIDESGAGNDKVTITGTANIAGKVTPNIIDLTSQSGSFVIADATGGITLSGAEAVDTATINFGLEVIGNELHLTFQPNAILTLLTGPITPNQLATVQNLDAITTNGGATPALQNLINILSGLPNEAAILAALDQLHAESYLANLPTTLFSNLDFAKSMLSCAQYEQGTNSHLKEDECYWAKLSGRQFNQDRSTNNIGIEETGFNFTGGIQFAVQPNWYLGLAASYEDTNTDIDTRAKTEGYRAQFGAVLKTQNGGTTFSAGLTGGFGNFDTKRFINFGGLNLVAEGDQDIQFGSVHTRLAHSFDMGGWYARPILDASLTYLELEGLRETGGGAANLNLSDVDEWYLSLSPSIEFGTEFKHNTDTIIRPFIKAGITYFNKNDISVSTSFNGAPAGVNAFQTSTEFDDLFVDLEVGVNIISGDGYNLKFNYEAHFAEDTQDHSGGVKLGVKF